MLSWVTKPQSHPCPRETDQVEGEQVTTQYTQPPLHSCRSEASVSSAPGHGIPSTRGPPTIQPRRDREKPKLLLEATKVVEQFVEQR